MFLSRFFGQSEAPSIRRPSPGRRPRLESLEGRQLLTTFMATNLHSSAIVGQHIGVAAVAEGGGGVGQHIGVAAVAEGGGGVGQHIGLAAVAEGGGGVGQHIGVAAVAEGGGGVGQHIGVATDSIQGNHIGTADVVGAAYRLRS